MFEYLPKATYDALIDAIEHKKPIDRQLADSVADGMRRWVPRQWRAPLHPLVCAAHRRHSREARCLHSTRRQRRHGRGVFGQVAGAAGTRRVELPNGGIRNTFEARGYSAWDISSPAFILDQTLCIPTIFISYTGESLDYKTPLLRALNAVDKAATAVARYFDPEVKHVVSNLGWEQEYFLVDESLYSARPDLVMTGRTLMGHESPKNQQLEDHYFGSIPRACRHSCSTSKSAVTASAYPSRHATTRLPQPVRAGANL